MTPPPLPPPDPDELASAIVDGLLPPHEADEARRDPAVARRVEDILRIRATVRATPPPPPGSADRAVAAALATFGASPETGDRAPQHLRVVGRSGDRPQPGRSPGWSTRSRSWLAAAAAILVVGLVAAGLVSQSGTDEDQTAAGDAESAETEASAEGEEESEGAADQPATADEGEAIAPVGPPHLGAVADAAELQDRVRDNLDVGEDAASRAPTDAGADVFGDDQSCLGLSALGDPARGTTTFVATADFQGNPVRVHLYELDGELRLVATDRSCTDVVDTPYAG
jgi:hypothetical protein